MRTMACRAARGRLWSAVRGPRRVRIYRLFSWKCARLCKANGIAAATALRPGMLALLAKKFFKKAYAFLFGVLWTWHSGRRAHGSRVLDNFESLGRMTPGGRVDGRETIPVVLAAKNLASAATTNTRSLTRILGGDDLRDRKSTTLVVAWMSPPLSSVCLRASVAESCLGGVAAP
jgi:hypothetical protein